MIRLFASLYKSYLTANKSKFVDWTSKILISINLLLTLGPIPDHYYPDINIAISLVGLWFYFLRIKLLSVVLLVFGLFLHFVHYCYD